MPDRDAKLQDGELLAAVDLGSNSFRMVVARCVLGQLRIVDRLRETVRLAAGLDARGGLDLAATQRALDCLHRFGQRLHTLPPGRVRAIATSTARQLARPQAFLLPAETALGHGIEVVSGREEARLIYLGVAHAQPPGPERRLVIDIGGGSTEFIIGEGFEPLERESLQVGCVATTLRFFGDGRLSVKRWRAALTEVSAEFQQFAAAYRRRGWSQVLGASGTIKAAEAIALKLGFEAIAPESVAAMRERLLGFDTVDAIRLPGLAADRRPVFPGGLLILEAACNEMDLHRLEVSDGAMREGILYDMLGRGGGDDPREASIRALAQRYGVDPAQAERVEATALALLAQVGPAWRLGDDAIGMLRWAARIHELGLAVAHSQHHKHGAYLVENSDIAGFSRQEQQWLAALVRCQRRSLPAGAIDALHVRIAESALRSIVLLRLAVLLHRSHEAQPPPSLALHADARSLRLDLPSRWLAAHPLTCADLRAEIDYLAEAGFDLALETVD